MKPTIGRIVIFKYPTNERCHHTNGAIECPAMIVRVWSDTCVNLKLIEDGPQNSWRTSVLQGELAGTDGASWRWPDREPKPLPATLTEASK